MIHLGINAYHPDASVALFKNGQLVWAAEEERFSRVKHAAGFPAEAMRHCLKETGIKGKEIDYVAISKSPRANLLKKMLFAIKNKPSPELILNRLQAMRRLTSINK